jgi:HAD superfamily hydrolase (TIGR01549 family)
MAIEVIFFDVGETLIDETRMWEGWAHYLGVPAPIVSAMLDEAIENGEHHRKVFERLRPDFDRENALRERAAEGKTYLFDRDDLYPDAAPCLRALRERGYLIGVAGNQPRGAVQTISKLGLEIDFVAASADWGVAKPSLKFFERIIGLSQRAPTKIAYVGDRLDNDVLPSKAAGITSIFLERGPWGRTHAKLSEASLADIWIKSLIELPEALSAFEIRCGR